jgi:vacuolar-type H+-ATPase subunit H
VEDNSLEKIENRNKTKETTQAVLVSGVIILMLYAVGFPMFLLFFLGIVVFFFYKLVGGNQKQLGSTHEIFEFFLSANDILRDDERRWFGFEVQEIIQRGERILRAMPDPPPLLYFTLGSLYNKVGNHKTAIEYLAYITENDTSDEKNRSVASPELRHYVQILRKIEQNPAEAPKMSAAVRALERARRNRATSILENSRNETWLLEEKRQSLLEAKSNDDKILHSIHEHAHEHVKENYSEKESPIKTSLSEVFNEEKPSQNGKQKQEKRQSISEVLYDIYDKK